MRVHAVGSVLLGLTFIGVVMNLAESANYKTASEIVTKVGLYDDENSRRTSTNPKLNEQSLATFLGKDVSFKERLIVNDDGGIEKKRFQQTYKGLPIFDTSLVLATNPTHHRSMEKPSSTIDGQVVEDIGNDLPSINTKYSCSDAVTFAVAELETSTTPFQIVHKEVDKMIYVPVTDLKAKVVCNFAYLVRYFDTLDRKCGFIDLNSGYLLKHWNCLMSQKHVTAKGYGGNPQLKYYEFGGPLFDQLTVTQSTDGRCMLQNENVTVVNLHNSVTVPSSAAKTPHKFACCEGSLGDETNGAMSPLNDAFFYGNIVVRMFRDWFGMYPTGSTRPVIGVHWGINMAQAIWTSTYQGVLLGDGDSSSYPFTSLDVIAHELGHGVTDRFSKLIYENQPGAVSEAFSDFTGVAADFYLKKGSSWTTGWAVSKVGKPVRVFNNPPVDGNSIDRKSQYKTGMNVHYSSGVFNKGLWALANNADWGIKKAFTVLLRANRLYWLPTSDYDNALCGIIQATKDLRYSDVDVIKAFNGVGVTCASGTASQRDEPHYRCKKYIGTVNNTLVFESMKPNEWREFRFNITRCARDWTVEVNSREGENNLYMYIKYDEPATWLNYDYGIDILTQNKKMAMREPTEGVWYGMVFATKEYKDSITVSSVYDQGEM